MHLIASGTLSDHSANLTLLAQSIFSLPLARSGNRGPLSRMCTVTLNTVFSFVVKVMADLSVKYCQSLSRPYFLSQWPNLA